MTNNNTSLGNLKMSNHQTNVNMMENRMAKAIKFAAATKDLRMFNALKSEVVIERKSILADIKDGYFTHADASATLLKCNAMMRKLRDAGQMTNATMRLQGMGAR